MELDKNYFISDNGLSFNCYLYKNLNKKTSLDKNIDPFMPPYDDNSKVADLGEDHVLLFNKFYFMKYQMLVITKKF